MHASTKQLFASQSHSVQIKGNNALELTLNERGAAKVCGTLTTLSPEDQRKLLALIRTGFKMVREGADPEAVAAVIRSEVHYECRS